MFGFKKEVINKEEKPLYNNEDYIKERERLHKEIEDEGRYRIKHSIVDDSIVFCLVKCVLWGNGLNWNRHDIDIGLFKTIKQARKAHKHILKEDIKL